MKYPLISVIIPTLNEEKNIAKCLESLFYQRYPQKKLEVLVVDDYSSDKTIEIAKKYPVKILYSGKKHGEISKMIGFKKAKGEYVMYLDADIQLRGKDWFLKMTKPLLKDANIVASFTKYYSNHESSPIERYLNFDPLQRDSIYQFFSPKFEEVVKEKKKNYQICLYDNNHILPAGLCLYRKKALDSIVGGYSMFLELDFLVLLVKRGFNTFAYVPSSGLYHKHVDSFSELIRKRIYNLNKVYLAREQRLYKWFDLNSLKGKIKVALWVIYANLLVPSAIVGIYKWLKFRDLAGLYEPVVNFLVTDTIILAALRNIKKL